MAPTLTLESIRRLADILGAENATASREDLERLVTSIVRRVTAAWSELHVDLESFVAHLGKLLQADELGSTPDLAYEDLYLAFACSTGQRDALGIFERDYSADFATATARMRLTPERAEDARQQLWLKLFVGHDGPPRILEYSGRGGLRPWFRVVAMRALLDDIRRAGRAPEAASDEWALEIPSSSDDPEVQYLKEMYGHEFRRAFEHALSELGVEDRNALRSYYAEHMTIDAMAVAFGIHRATAARRVERARQNLVQATRAVLADRLALTTQALESVIRMVESNLHISVARLLSQAR
jgi:RNA polymerase sigma-70 factor (ECF subfamily)